MSEIDEYGTTVSGDMLHMWNEPSVGMFHPEIVMQILHNEQVVTFSVFCKEKEDTEQLFNLLKKSYIAGVEIVEADNGREEGPGHDEQ